LPAGAAAELLGTARAAFTQALELSAIISAVVVLGMAVMTWLLLRRMNGLGREGRVSEDAREHVDAQRDRERKHRDSEHRDPGREPNLHNDAGVAS
jgi:hypothetical protein